MGIFGTSSPFDPLLDKACNESVVQEDWSMILSICDKARASPRNSKDCLTSITKKLHHKIPRVALQALVVLDACTSNGGREFQKAVCSQEFINELRPIVGRSDLVGEKCKELIMKWTKEYEHDSELSMIVSFYHFLRANGTHFPEPKTDKKSRNTNPDAVDNQKEADDIALALQLSMQDDEVRKNSSKTKQVQSLYYSTLQASPKAEQVVKVKALYDFEAVEDNELTFKSGDIITLVEECDPNWWEGSFGGKSGLFPANFVTKTLQEEPEPPPKVDNKVIITVDEALLDLTLEQVESADPTELHDPPEMLQNEERCGKMGAIIDSKLSEMDTEQLELTQLNQKILQCLQLYDALMQDQLPTMNTSYMPQITTSMASMSIPYQPSGYEGQQQYQIQPVQSYPQPVETPIPDPHMSQGHVAPPGVSIGGYQHQNFTQAPSMYHHTPPNPSSQPMYHPQGYHQAPYIAPPGGAPSPYYVYEPTAPPPTPPVSEGSSAQAQFQAQFQTQVPNQPVPQHQPQPPQNLL